YLWGFDNSSIFKFIPVLVIFILNTDIDNKKSKFITFILIFITFLAFLYVKSITAMLASFVILLYYILFYIRGKKVKTFNFRNCIILIFLISAILIGVNKNIPALQYIADKTDK